MRLLCLAMLVACGAANGQVYKCNVGGAVLFQDRPCDGVGQKVEVRPASGTAASSTAPIDALRLNVKGMELERRIKETEHQVVLGERDINGLQAQRDRELQALQVKKSVAKNNLAGATWEQSISTEMTAVSETYRTRIQVVRDRIDGYRKDIADLRKQRDDLGK